MARRHKPIVLLLRVEDFAVLEASVAEHHHDPYLHAHWLLAERLGIGMPFPPDLTEDTAPVSLLAETSAARREPCD